MYESFYNLTKKPFQLNPDPAFFFNSTGHKRALAYLKYGLAQGEGFIVVTGSPGTGKTMLVKELFKELLGDNVIAGQLVTTQVDAIDTLRMIAATFDLAHEGTTKATLLNNLEKFFRSKAREGKRVLLVVDEAQNLPKQSLEELRMLSNFEENGQSFFQSFLLGQEDFRKILLQDSMEQVRQRVTANYHLRPLDQDETEQYILHRLKTAGWQENPKFTKQIFADIFQFTNGIPRKINTLCDRLLLYAFLEELKIIDQEAVSIVTQELDEDSPKQEVQRSYKVGSRSINTSPLKSQSRSNPKVVPHGSVDKRLKQLEDEVNNIIDIQEKEKALLRKAILLHLEMDDDQEASVDKTIEYK
ncbi:MAG: XrtA/PEP-CTERM system-associated ATPase [Methylococcales bacterium]